MGSYLIYYWERNALQNIFTGFIIKNSGQRDRTDSQGGFMRSKCTVEYMTHRNCVGG